MGAGRPVMSTSSSRVSGSAVRKPLQTMEGPGAPRPSEAPLSDSALPAVGPGAVGGCGLGGGRPWSAQVGSEWLAVQERLRECEVTFSHTKNLRPPAGQLLTTASSACRVISVLSQNISVIKLTQPSGGFTI